MQAIVYSSNAGHTAQYAHMLEQMISLPVYTLDDAKQQLDKGTDIIYLGWIKSGKVYGLNKASKYFDTQAIAAVGTSEVVNNTDEIRLENNIKDDIPVFFLQGGIELEKLNGRNKHDAITLEKRVVEDLSSKKRNSIAERLTLDLFKQGRSKVNQSNLKDLLLWANQEN